MKQFQGRLTLLLTLTVCLSLAAPAGAETTFPLTTGGGPVFSRTQAPPAQALYTGPLAVSVVRAGAEKDYLYLYINGRRMFDDSGTVFGNGINNTGWLTARGSRSEIWSWSIPGKVNRLTVGESIFQSAQKQTSLYLVAITQLGEAVIMVRRQLNLVWPAFKPGRSIDLPRTLEAMLADSGPLTAVSRMDGVIYLANKGRLLNASAKAPLALAPIDIQRKLPAGAQARRQALKDLAVEHEYAMSDAVKALLDKLIKGSGDGDR